MAVPTTVRQTCGTGRLQRRLRRCAAAQCRPQTILICLNQCVPDRWPFRFYVFRSASRGRCCSRGVFVPCQLRPTPSSASLRGADFSGLIETARARGRPPLATSHGSLPGADRRSARRSTGAPISRNGRRAGHTVSALPPGGDLPEKSAGHLLCSMSAPPYHATLG